MAIPSITSLPARRARSTYRRPKFRPVDRPAAHRADRVTPSPRQLAAIRRRRTAVKRVQAYLTVHIRHLCLGFIAGAVLALTVIGALTVTDPTARGLIAVLFIAGTVLWGIDWIAARTSTDEADA